MRLNDKARALGRYRSDAQVRRAAMTLETISSVNLDRALVWHPDGLEGWSVSDWAVAMAGEAGEVCNAVKKLNRIGTEIRQAEGPSDRDAALRAIANEIGDTFLYLDLLAQRLGLRIEDCVSDTFNRVSVREGFPHRLPPEARDA